MVHTALAGIVPIVANRPCLSTHYKLYATLQVTLLVHWLPCADTTHPKRACQLSLCSVMPTLPVNQLPCLCRPSFTLIHYHFRSVHS
jgi:hypothetical protein